MPILTAARLNTLKTWPKLTDNWHFLSATVLTTLNQTQDIPQLYKYSIQNSPSDQHSQLTSQFRESLLKSAALIGLPRVINALTALKLATPDDLRAKSLIRDSNRVDFSEDGRKLFAQVYGKITNRVHSNLHNAYPDLDWFIQNFEYGPLLAHMSILDAKQTSMVIISALVPQNVNPQLKGHLKGALNNGATVEETNEVRAMVMELCRWYGHKFEDEVSKL